MSDEIQKKPKTYFSVVDGRKQAKLYYRVPALVEHLLMDHQEKMERNPAKEWCNARCMANAFRERVTENSMKRQRQRISQCQNKVIDMRYLILKMEETKDEPHPGRLKQWKLCDPSRAEDRQRALEQLDVMKERREISKTRWEKGMRIIVGAPKPESELLLDSGTEGE